MKKVIIFGAGNLGSVLAAELSQDNEIVGFIDNNQFLWGKWVAGYEVLGGTEKIKSLDYDEIVIASTMRFDDIRNDLIEAGIGDGRLNHAIQNRLLVEVQARVNFIRDFAREFDRHEKEACVAEGGVFQGMFAAEINRCFPDRKLYLFDTFEGFNGKDVDIEKANGYSDVKTGYYNETSEEVVLSRMPNKNNVEIRKGHFPDTVTRLNDEKFIFVNLDFDLYAPTLDGLKFFYPRLVKNGIILIHDYFTQFYHGVKEAVDSFEKNNNVSFRRLPIGDGISIAIIPQEGTSVRGR